MKKYGIPLLVVALAAVGTLYLVSQDRAVKINDKGQPMQTAPAPGPVPPRSPVVEPKPGEVPVPGGVIRSLDKINEAAARVGCETLKPDDPAGKLIDVAECLGAKAVSARGQK
jgi:hypothetical protein